jgi:hypothetical protein
VADAAAGMLVAGMIGITGGDILMESVKQLSDSAHEELQQEVELILRSLQDDDVVSTASIRARQVGSAAVAEVTVEIHPGLTTTATRAVEERIQQYLQKGLSKGHQGRPVIVTVYAKPNLLICPLLRHQGEEVDVAWYNQDDSQQINSHHNDHTRKVQNNDKSSSMETNSSTAARIYSTTTKRRGIISAAQIEHEVRQQVLMLYPKIHCHVSGVTVHFSSHNTVKVDCNIWLDPSSTTTTTTNTDNNASTLMQVQQHAKELQRVLENNLPQVESARIYLDLNQESPVHAKPSHTLQLLL